MAGKRKKANNKFRISSSKAVPAITQNKEPGNSKPSKQFERKKQSKISGSYNLAVKAIKLLRGQPRAIIWILFIYGALTLLFVRGFSNGTDLTSAKESLLNFFNGQGGFSGAGTIFNSLFSNNSYAGSASAYQTFLLIVTSLALIWTYRHVNENVKAKDAFYRGTSQFIPYLLVLFVMVLQLIPLLIGSTLYSIVISNGLAVSNFEKVIWLVVFIVLALLSLYFVASSLIATYIASLPDSTPIKSLRLSRRVVKRRRFVIIGRILSLLFIFLMAFSLIMIPIILWLTAIASWIVFILGLAAIALFHAYMFSIYQELI